MIPLLNRYTGDGSMSDMAPGLRKQAVREASDLTITPEELAGREFRAYCALDTPNAKILDDAFLVTHDWTERVLHAGISDVANFVHDGSALQRAAEVQSRYRGFRVFPAVLGRKLGLSDSIERPILSAHISITAQTSIGNVALTRERTIVDSITSEGFAARVQQEDGEGPFSALQLLANDFRRREQRQAGKEPKIRAKSVYPDVLASVTQEAIARYMLEHEIPGIFRVAHSPSAHTPPAELTVSPEPDAGQKVLAYCMSPLRRYFDYVNHANLNAHMENRGFPFGLSRLQAILDEHIENGRRQTYPLADTIHQTLCRTARGTSTQEVGELQSQLAQAIFGLTQGSEEAIRTMQHQALQILDERPELAGQALTIAQSKGFITVKDHPDPEVKQKILVMQDGREFGYPRQAGPRASIRERHLRLFRQILEAGAEAHPDEQ